MDDCKRECEIIYKGSGLVLEQLLTDELLGNLEKEHGIEITLIKDIFKKIEKRYENNFLQIVAGIKNEIPMSLISVVNLIEGKIIDRDGESVEVNRYASLTGESITHIKEKYHDAISIINQKLLRHGYRQKYEGI